MISSHHAGNDKYIQGGPSVTFRWPVLFFRRITDGRTGKTAIRDGRDNYAGAARQLSDALQQAGQTGTRQAVSNGAAALVQSGIKSGKAVSEIAAGTAAGGPWGAILSAAWSLRHTLFKILACLCVLLLIFVILIVSIPSVVLNGVFGLNGSIVDMDNPMSMMQSYEEMSA